MPNENDQAVLAALRGYSVYPVKNSALTHRRSGRFDLRRKELEWVNRVRAPGRAGRRFTAGTGKQSVPVPDSQDAAPGGAPADSTIANPAEPSPRAGGGRFAGALFVDLLGYSTPVPPETALGSLPRALDVPAL